MGFLKRLAGRDQAPDWTPFGSGAQYRVFIEAVENDLRRRGLSFLIGDGVVELDNPAGTGPERLGLGNVAQLCNLVPEAQWPQVVAGHFDGLFADQGDDYAADFELARPLLKPRIYATADLPPDGQVVSSPVAPGLTAVLTYDLPTTVRTVSRDDAGGWPVPVDELFAIAVANLETAPDRPEAVEVPLDGGGAIQGLQGESFFVASEILRLAAYLPSGPSNGALVAVPNRHALLYHAILDTTAIVAVQVMIQLAVALHRQGPGSISPELFWWHDGGLTPLPSSTGDNSIEFFPPDEFVAVLNGLSEPGS